jgi:hypothetical protein
MATEYEKTQEESTFDQILWEELESLSEAARAALQQAHEVADKVWMSDWYSYQTEEYQDDMKAMRRSAADITGEDCEGLTKIWRSALAAAASVDPYDYETIVGWRTYRGQLHEHYKMFSRLVEDFESDKRIEELRKKEDAEREPVDAKDPPF